MPENPLIKPSALPEGAVPRDALNPPAAPHPVATPFWDHLRGGADLESSAVKMIKGGSRESRMMRDHVLKAARDAGVEEA